MYDGRTSISKKLPRYIFDGHLLGAVAQIVPAVFYQRRYEWASIIPICFKRLKTWKRIMPERRIQGEKAYYWIGPDFPLSRIRDEKDRLVKSRVDALVKMLVKKQQQEMWSDSLFDEMELAQSRCGLFCGK